MYPISDIITLLEAAPDTSSYNIAKAQVIQPNYLDAATIPDPSVLLSYIGIATENPNVPRSSCFVDDLAINLTQTLGVYIFSTLDNLPTVWRNVHKTLVGQNTQPLEAQFTGLTYKEGTLIGIEGDYCWWLDYWQVGFPTVNQFA